MTKMTMAEYAAHRGCDRSVVTRAADRGAVLVHEDEHGKRFVYAEESDALWTQNTDQNTGRAANQRRKKAEVKANEVEASDEDSEDDADGETPKLYASRALKEKYLAQAAKLKFETDFGLMVRAEDVEKKWSTILSLVRTKVLGIPSKTRQRFPDMPTELFVILEGAVREALEDLAEGES